MSLHINSELKLKFLISFKPLEFFLAVFDMFKLKQYQLFPVISMHVEKQCSSPFKCMHVSIYKKVCLSETDRHTETLGRRE